MNPTTLHRHGIISRKEYESMHAERNGDNWPKHPDGTNMMVGEMSEEDRARVLREASERSRARVTGVNTKRGIVE